MPTTVAPFLMFEGQAEEAMNLYVSTIPGSQTLDVRRYGAGEPGPEGSVMTGTFSLGGLTVMCSDSYVKHAFTFTPSASLYVTCQAEEEFDRIVATLGDGGELLMPPDNYGFSRKFGWLNDRYSVSWQINLA